MLKSMTSAIIKRTNYFGRGACESGWFKPTADKLWFADERDRIGSENLLSSTTEDAAPSATDKALLVASHIVGWAESPEHRGDLSNVVCLCRAHDALFEAGYWSLGGDLKVLKKKNVASKTLRDLLGGMNSLRLPLEFPPAQQFLKRHRRKFGFKM